VRTIEDQGLILDHHPFKDRHLIVAALTPSHGVIRGVLRSARGGKIPLAGSVQVLSRVRLEFFRKPAAELATFRRVELLTYCPPDEPAPRRFRLGVVALDELLAGTDPDRVIAYVQFWVLQLGGLMPPPDQLDGDPDADELALIIACRHVPLTELALEVPASAQRRLDSMVRHQAERPLRALDFYRTHGA
jgi:hypothetical protein